MAGKNIDIQKEEMDIQGNSMTKSFSEKLIEILKTDSRFVDDEGELIKAAVIDRAWKIDRDLVKLLLSKPEIEKKFFDEIEGHWIFNINTFIEYISDKNFLANSYTRFRNKIGLNIDGKFMRERGEVSLVWPYKDCVLEGGQMKEEEKRKEIFFNEILAQDEIDRLFDPKVLTNWKRYSPDGEQKVTEIKRDENGTIRENMIIKGNNLLALHTLKTQFRGKVKMIYIDPPYNTGSDSFGYNDNFNHSSWLTFMKNRLEISKELLRKDGAIVIHCDFIEDNYLKVLMDEIFGRDNFVNSIAIRDSHPSGLKLSARDKTIVKTKSTILVYKNGNEIKINPVYQRRHEWDKHFNAFIDIEKKDRKRISLSEYIKKNKIVSDRNFILNEQALLNEEFRGFAFNNRHKIFQSTKEIPKEAKEKSLENRDVVIEYSEGEYALNGRRLSPLSKSIYNIGFDGYFEEDFGKLLCDFWDDVDFNNSQNEGGVSFPSGKKPELLLARLISMFTQQDEIVCDFYLGSGTTAAVAHKMGRQYVGVEQLNYGRNDSITRLNNVIKGDQTGVSKVLNWQGGGGFIYCELMKYNEAFMDKIQSAKTSEELVALWSDIAENSFLNWYVNPQVPEEAIKDFEAIGKSENGLEKQKKLLAELLNKNQLYVNLSEIDDVDFEVSKEDKELNRLFYGESYNG